MLFLLDRQGTFQGDLNRLQEMALVKVMGTELEREIDLEKLRATNMGLATNPATSREFLLNLLQEETVEEEYITDRGWTTPQSVQEIEEFLRTQSL